MLVEDIGIIWILGRSDAAFALWSFDLCNEVSIVKVDAKSKSIRRVGTKTTDRDGKGILG